MSQALPEPLPQLPPLPGQEPPLELAALKALLRRAPLPRGYPPLLRQQLRRLSR